jgi:hypothetical protein
MSALLELFAELFFELAVVGTGHGVCWLLPIRRKFSDSEAAFAGVLFWLIVIAGVVWWRLS